MPAPVPGAAEDPDAAPVGSAPGGTGPFERGGRDAGDHTELEANPDGRGEGPCPERAIRERVPALTMLRRARSGHA